MLSSKSQSKEAKPKFPCLMKHTTSTLIVLVTGITHGNMDGTALISNGTATLGKFSVTWCACNFEPYTGTVTITGE